jgi:hypothetical protein
VAASQLAQTARKRQNHAPVGQTEQGIVWPGFPTPFVPNLWNSSLEWVEPLYNSRQLPSISPDRVQYSAFALSILTVASIYSAIDAMAYDGGRASVTL